jgi:hypothetical protein
VSLIASKFVSPDRRQDSVVVLNNTSRSQVVRVVGVKPSRSYFAVAWNRDGTGSLASLPRVRSDAGGAATVTVPAHGLVALSTRPPGL